MTAQRVPQARRSEHLTVTAAFDAVGCVRLFTRYVLSHWRVSDDGIYTAQLLISELVTNAIQSTGNPEDTPDIYPDAADQITARLVLYDRSIAIEVWDTSPEPPTPKNSGPDSESGRGLLLIESLSTRWDYYPRRGGKVVWCEIEAEIEGSWDQAERASALPRRPPPKLQLRRIRRMNDPDILKRVLHGLLALDNQGCQGR